jgi:hypothetical protein
MLVNLAREMNIYIDGKDSKGIRRKGRTVNEVGGGNSRWNSAHCWEVKHFYPVFGSSSVMVTPSLRYLGKVRYNGK